MTMLTALLDILDREGLYRPADLARRLSVSEALVEQMLVTLQKAGYLQAVENCSCSAQRCTDCPVQASCATRRARLWIVRRPAAGRPPDVS